MTLKKAQQIIKICITDLAKDGEWAETAAELAEMIRKYEGVIGLIKEAAKAPSKAELEALRKEGLTLEQIAKRLKASRSSVANWLKAYDLVSKKDDKERLRGKLK